MLLVYYCDEPECRRAYIRSDERSVEENQICPNCRTPMFFVADYRYWSSVSEERRKMLVKRRLKASPFAGGRGIGREKSRPVSREELLEENRLLQEEQERLKRSLQYYTRLRQYWEKVANRLHDAIWTVLVKEEPARYGILYPDKKFDENVEELLASLPRLK